MTHFFLNNTQTIVPESVDGLIRSSRIPLAKLDVGSPEINVVVRSDWTSERSDKEVALICGGGSGHEPMHAGFVGEGMLTAAVCGGLFASPSIDAVLSTILHVSGKAGCLVLTKAYTGDCLNFGLAVEKAKQMGINAEIVIISDDISLPNHNRPRGLAGTIFVHKVASYFAQQGKSLAAVKEAAELAVKNIATIGVAITSCTTPSASGDRIESGKAELGLGIHGEPGVTTLDTQNVDQLVETMMAKLGEKVKGEVAILLNNLGGVSELEMGIICSTILNQKPVGVTPKLLVGPSAFCTSLDMKGFSITMMQLSPEVETALKAPVSVNAWKEPVQIAEAKVIKAKKTIPPFECQPSHNEKVEKIVRVICDCLIEKEDELNLLDSYVGDGDTGYTFASGARSVLKELNHDRLPLNDLSTLFARVGDLLSKTMGGSSGVLLAILAMQTSAALKDGETLQQSLQSGLAKMMLLGGGRPGMRTMIDALEPAFQALDDGVNNAHIAAVKGAEATKNMTRAGAGRSSYLNADSLRNHADPGATAISMVFNAIAAM